MKIFKKNNQTMIIDSIFNKKNNVLYKKTVYNLNKVKLLKIKVNNLEIKIINKFNYQKIKNLTNNFPKNLIKIKMIVA